MTNPNCSYGFHCCTPGETRIYRTPGRWGSSKLVCRRCWEYMLGEAGPVNLPEWDSLIQTEGGEKKEVENGQG